MFKLLRRLARAVVDKIRNMEFIMVRIAMYQRRGTIHSICDLRPGHKQMKRRTTIQSICEVSYTIQYSPSSRWLLSQQFGAILRALTRFIQEQQIQRGREHMISARRTNYELIVSKRS